MARRYTPELTEAERDAILDALNAILAGPIEGREGPRRETYEAAANKVAEAPKRSV